MVTQWLTDWWWFFIKIILFASRLQTKPLALKNHAAPNEMLIEMHGSEESSRKEKLNALMLLCFITLGKWIKKQTIIPYNTARKVLTCFPRIAQFLSVTTIIIHPFLFYSMTYGIHNVKLHVYIITITTQVPNCYNTVKKSRKQSPCVYILKWMLVSKYLQSATSELKIILPSAGGYSSIRSICMDLLLFTIYLVYRVFNAIE